MTITKEQFSTVVTLIHQDGVDQAIAEFPEVAQHRDALAQLEKAEHERQRLEELEGQASANVDHIELELRQRLVEAEG